MGLKIGDIAELPQKTLGLLINEKYDGPAKNRKSDLFPEEILSTVVIGSELSPYFKNHPKRYPQLQLNFPEKIPINFLKSLPREKSADLLLLQIDSLHEKYFTPLIKAKKTGVGIFVYYQFSQSKILEQLETYGIYTFKGGLDQPRIDDLVKRAVEKNQYLAPLYASAKQFSIPIMESQERLFSDEALAEARLSKKELHCECPTHLVELINALNAFEEYSKECEADNWQDAAIHACIYSYTVKARHLMEKSLMTVMVE